MNKIIKKSPLNIIQLFFGLLISGFFGACSDDSTPVSPVGVVWNPLTLVTIIPDTSLKLQIPTDKNGIVQPKGNFPKKIIIDQFEITIGQFDLFEQDKNFSFKSGFEIFLDSTEKSPYSTNPDSFQSAINDYAVQYITWAGAANFCNWRSGKRGLTECYDSISGSVIETCTGFRLPTEAEWQIVLKMASPGSTFNYRFGKINFDFDVSEKTLKSKDETLKEIVISNGEAVTLFGMLGNVFEWTSNFYSIPEDSVTFKGPTAGQNHIFVGIEKIADSLVYHRNTLHPVAPYPLVGFRCVQNQPE